MLAAVITIDYNESDFLKKFRTIVNKLRSFSDSLASKSVFALRITPFFVDKHSSATIRCFSC